MFNFYDFSGLKRIVEKSKNNCCATLRTKTVEETGCKEVATVIFQRKVLFTVKISGNKKSPEYSRLYFMVPLAGIEPARP